MADTVESAGYWLPPEFFDDTVTDQQNHLVDSGSGLCFPTEFPYLIDSAECFKEKRRVMFTSPKSTLAHTWTFSGRSCGSPNGVASPTNDAVGDLAAGQVAKLKLSAADVPGPANNSGLVGPTKRLDQLLRPSAFDNIYLEEQMMKQGCGMPQFYRGWPVQLNPAHVGRPPGSRAISFGRSSGGSAGTGVFLPRKYENVKNDYRDNDNSSVSRKGAGYIAERYLHAINRPNFNPGFVALEYDMLMARRNALLLQHKRSLLLEGSSRANRGVRLPHEWTY